MQYCQPESVVVLIILLILSILNLNYGYERPRTEDRLVLPTIAMPQLPPNTIRFARNDTCLAFPLSLGGISPALLRTLFAVSPVATFQAMEGLKHSPFRWRGAVRFLVAEADGDERVGDTSVWISIHLRRRKARGEQLREAPMALSSTSMCWSDRMQFIAGSDTFKSMIAGPQGLVAMLARRRRPCWIPSGQQRCPTPNNNRSAVPMMHEEKAEYASFPCEANDDLVSYDLISAEAVPVGLSEDHHQPTCELGNISISIRHEFYNHGGFHDLPFLKTQFGVSMKLMDKWSTHGAVPFPLQELSMGSAAYQINETAAQSTFFVRVLNDTTLPRLVFAFHSSRCWAVTPRRGSVDNDAAGRRSPEETAVDEHSTQAPTITRTRHLADRVCAMGRTNQVTVFGGHFVRVAQQLVGDAERENLPPTAVRNATAYFDNVARHASALLDIRGWTRDIQHPLDGHVYQWMTPGCRWRPFLQAVAVERVPKQKQREVVTSTPAINRKEGRRRRSFIGLLAVCLAKKRLKVLFLGDSQVRSLYQAAISAMLLRKTVMLPNKAERRNGFREKYYGRVVLSSANTSARRSILRTTQAGDVFLSGDVDCPPSKTDSVRICSESAPDVFAHEIFERSTVFDNQDVESVVEFIWDSLLLNITSYSRVRSRARRFNLTTDASHPENMKPSKGPQASAPRSNASHSQPRGQFLHDGLFGEHPHDVIVLGLGGWLGFTGWNMDDVESHVEDLVDALMYITEARVRQGKSKPLFIFVGAPAWPYWGTYGLLRRITNYRMGAIVETTRHALVSLYTVAGGNSNLAILPYFDISYPMTHLQVAWNDIHYDDSMVPYTVVDMIATLVCGDD
jgi:hypothetical protein